MADLVLDRDVRDWVLLPLTLVIFLMMLIRQYATSVSCRSPSLSLLEELSNNRTLPSFIVPSRVKVFFSAPPVDKTSLKEMREKQAMNRAQLTRQNNGFIPQNAYKQRRAFFVAKVTRLRFTSRCYWYRGSLARNTFQNKGKQ